MNYCNNTTPVINKYITPENSNNDLSVLFSNYQMFKKFFIIIIFISVLILLAVLGK